MNGLADNAITIDTNVFVHMFNEKINTGQHIDKLLLRLVSDSILLNIDDGGFIGDEYEEKLGKLRRRDDTGSRVQILRYWMTPEVQREIEVDRTGKLMTIIKTIITEPDENVDRTFVAVALVSDVVLSEPS